MKLDILDIPKFVKVNQLTPVTVPTFFEADGSPTPGGLFSIEIFGRQGSEDRRRRWSYIDLGGRFLHPLVYKTCCQLDRKFPEIIAGSRRIKLSPTGVMATVPEDEEGGWTGIDGLYDNWDRINWSKAEKVEIAPPSELPSFEGGGQRAERTGLLKTTPRETAFVTQWPVIPAIYRDVETSSADRVKEIAPINYLYVQLLITGPTQISGLTFADGYRKRKCQETLLEIHRSELELIAGKKGLIQDRVLGKYTDWAIRGVLSGPALAKAEHPGDQEVPFGTLGVPLYLVINAFQPFILKSISERMRVIAESQERVLVSSKDGKPTYFELPPEAKVQLGPELYRKWIARFMRSQENRTDLLTVTTGRGKEVAIPLYDKWLGRPTTLLDLFYITASVVVADKFVEFTRYPVEDFRACHFSKVSILTTEKTEDITIGGTRYPRYPSLSKPMRWVDSFRLNNSYTTAMGADFDGDTHRLIGIFTQEANAEAERLIKQPTNFCDGQGNFCREIKNEAVLTLYALTK